MRSLRPLLLGLLLAWASPALFPAGADGPAPAPEAGAGRDVSALLGPLLAKHGVPGMAAAVVTGEGLVASGAAGVRAKGGEAPVTTGDLWHLGSCTKAMTATLCALLVEEGRLRWNTTVGDAFAALPVHAAWRKVTLEQLLTQTAGAPPDLSADGLWARLWKREGTPMDQRLALARGVLGAPPVHEPGSRFLYANANFALAGAMAERAAAKRWEDLIRARLFEPLGMSSAGFGAPGKAGQADQPRGHRADGTPVEPGPDADNPPAIGPGGTVHATVADFGRFVSMHLRGARGKERLLGRPTFRRLHTPPEGIGSEYAMGWAVTKRPWGGRVLTHSGSNTMWYCVAWLAPEKDFAVVVCCNIGGEAGSAGTDAAAWALIQDHVRATAGTR